MAVVGIVNCNCFEMLEMRITSCPSSPRFYEQSESCIKQATLAPSSQTNTLDPKLPKPAITVEVLASHRHGDEDPDRRRGQLPRVCF